MAKDRVFYFMAEAKKCINPAVKILYKEPFKDNYQAAISEKQIKGWTGVKKLALEKGELHILTKL